MVQQVYRKREEIESQKKFANKYRGNHRVSRGVAKFVLKRNVRPGR